VVGVKAWPCKASLLFLSGVFFFFFLKVVNLVFLALGSSKGVVDGQVEVVPKRFGIFPLENFFFFFFLESLGFFFQDSDLSLHFVQDHPWFVDSKTMAWSLFLTPSFFFSLGGLMRGIPLTSINKT